MTSPDVIVIGAGCAGLAAACALAARGARVLVLEARGQLGGRATAFQDRESAEWVDNGQHVMFGCYHATFAFLRRIGAEGNVRVQRAMSVPYLDRQGRRSELRCPPLPAPLHLVAGVLRQGRASRTHQPGPGGQVPRGAPRGFDDVRGCRASPRRLRPPGGHRGALSRPGFTRARTAVPPAPDPC